MQTEQTETARTRNHERWQDLCDQQDREDSSDDVILFIEGSHYLETFGEQAKLVSEALDFLLVTRDGVTSTGIAVGDDRNIKRLVRMGYTVRIATAVAR